MCRILAIGSAAWVPCGGCHGYLIWLMKGAHFLCGNRGWRVCVATKENTRYICRIQNKDWIYPPWNTNKWTAVELELMNFTDSQMQKSFSWTDGLQRPPASLDHLAKICVTLAFFLIAVSHLKNMSHFPTQTGTDFLKDVQLFELYMFDLFISFLGSLKTWIQLCSVELFVF